MDRKSKEDIKKQIQQLLDQNKTMAQHLEDLTRTLSAPSEQTPVKSLDWEAVWRAIYHNNLTLRSYLPGVNSLGWTLVRHGLNAKVAKATPWQLADLTRHTVTKYLNVRGGVYEALYSQLNRGAVAGKLVESDPEVVDLIQRIGDELTALHAGVHARDAVLLHISVIEACTSALQVLCTPTEEARAAFSGSFYTLLERHITDPSVALELLLGD